MSSQDRDLAAHSPLSSVPSLAELPLPKPTLQLLSPSVFAGAGLHSSLDSRGGLGTGRVQGQSWVHILCCILGWGMLLAILTLGSHDYGTLSDSAQVPIQVPSRGYNLLNITPVIGWGWGGEPVKSGD